MVTGDRILPVAEPRPQRIEKLRCVLRIRLGIECLRKAGECAGMPGKIYLEAADVDTRQTGFCYLQSAHGGDRIDLAVE